MKRALPYLLLFLIVHSAKMAASTSDADEPIVDSTEVPVETEFRPRRYINYSHKQCAWREAELIIEHLDQDDSVTALTTMLVKAQVTLESHPSARLATNDHYWPIIIELREINVAHQRTGHDSLDYDFTTRVSFLGERERFEQLHRFKWLMFQPIGVRLSNSGSLVHRFCDVRGAGIPFDPAHIDLVQTAARLVVRELELAFANQDINNEFSSMTWLHLHPGNILAECAGNMDRTEIVSETEEGGKPKTTIRLDVNDCGRIAANFSTGPVAALILNIAGDDSIIVPCACRAEGDVTWLEQAGLDSVISEHVEFEANSDHLCWNPTMPWKLPNKARVALTVTSQPPRQ